MSNLTKLGDYREFRTNEQWENKTRQEGGCLSSLEVLKSNTSCRGYPKKRWESKKKQVIFYGFPSIVRELNFFCHYHETARDVTLIWQYRIPGLCLSWFFFSFSEQQVGGQVTTVSPASAEALWMKIAVKSDQQTGSWHKKQLPWLSPAAGEAQRNFETWDGHQREGNKLWQEIISNPKKTWNWGRRNPCYEEHKPPSEDPSSYRHDLLQTDTHPFLLEGNWICQLWDPEVHWEGKDKIREKAWMLKKEKSVAGLSFYY